MSGPADEVRELAGWAAGIAAGMSIVALADLPYGYYMLLRLVVFGAAGLGCWWLWLKGWKGPAVAIAVIALLFNPIIRVHLDKETWRVFNVIAAAALGTVAFLALRRPVASQQDQSP